MKRRGGTAGEAPPAPRCEMVPDTLSIPFNLSSALEALKAAHTCCNLCVLRPRLVIRKFLVTCPACWQECVVRTSSSLAEVQREYSDIQGSYRHSRRTGSPRRDLGAWTG